MITQDEAIAMVMRVQEKINRNEMPDLDECTEAAGALIEVGIVIDDGDGYRPNLKRLQDCPEDVRYFVSGMTKVNDELIGKVIDELQK